MFTYRCTPSPTDICAFAMLQALQHAAGPASVCQTLMQYLSRHRDEALRDTMQWQKDGRTSSSDPLLHQAAPAACMGLARLAMNAALVCRVGIQASMPCM